MAAMKKHLFVTDYPTLWPSMLLRHQRQPSHPPFNAERVHWCYFARNAVWRTVKMLGLEGKDVLVPAYHHGVEIEALVDAGARPVFYRIGSHWEVDLEDVERRITPQTGALYLTHFAGFPGPMREMKALAERHGLPLVEDCALSLLSADGDLPVGTVGDLSIFCLYKTLPVPNGGAMMINSDRHYDLPELPPAPIPSVISHTASALLKNLEMRGGATGARIRRGIRALGHVTVRSAKIERVPTGTMHFNRDHLNMGMSPLTRRIAGALDTDRIVELRRRNYFHLLTRLRDVSRPLFSELAPGVSPLFYPLVVEDKADMMDRLRGAGIRSVDFWRDSHPACNLDEFPEVRQLRRSIVEIPCHQDLDQETQARVAQIVREAIIAQQARGMPRKAQAR